VCGFSSGGWEVVVVLATGCVGWGLVGCAAVGVSGGSGSFFGLCWGLFSAVQRLVFWFLDSEALVCMWPCSMYSSASPFGVLV
jgi:hypothetical protein